MALPNIWSAGEVTPKTLTRGFLHPALNIPDQFYMTLLSNASQDHYPDNTIGAFTVELARPILTDTPGPKHKLGGGAVRIHVSRPHRQGRRPHLYRFDFSTVCGQFSGPLPADVRLPVARAAAGPI